MTNDKDKPYHMQSHSDSEEEMPEVANLGDVEASEPEDSSNSESKVTKEEAKQAKVQEEVRKRLRSAKLGKVEVSPDIGVSARATSLVSRPYPTDERCAGCKVKLC